MCPCVKSNVCIMLSMFSLPLNYYDSTLSLNSHTWLVRAAILYVQVTDSGWLCQTPEGILKLGQAHQQGEPFSWGALGMVSFLQ